MTTNWKTYLQSKGATFAEEQLVGFSTTPQALTDNAIAVLCGQCLISIAGADRQQLLQGQISTHMSRLKPLQHSQGVACSPKGRMYTTFRILNTGERYLLSMNAGVVDGTLATLNKYAIFFKTELLKAPEYLTLGLSGADIDTILDYLFSNSPLPEDNHVFEVAEQCYLLKTGDSRYELWLHQNCLPHWWPVLTAKLLPVTETFWRLLNIESVLPQLNQATVDQYIPQHLNQPTIGSISFKKGCFTGQEIITRMQNLGHQKSRCYRLTLNNSNQPKINARLYNSDGKVIGEVIESAVNLAGTAVELLAVIRIEAAEANDVFLDAGQPLQVHALPYVIDQKAELQQ